MKTLLLGILTVTSMLAQVRASNPAKTVVPDTAYWVDGTNGNDVNDGLSPYSPVKTVATLVARDTANNRQQWCLAGTLRETVTVPRNNMTVGWCGTGTRPLVDASDQITATWSLTAGQTKTYQATISPAIAASKTQVYVWLNGAVMTRQTSIANVEANAGSFYASADIGAGPITLYVHSTGDSNPSSDGKLYEVTMRQYAVDSRNVTGVTIQGVWARRPLHNDGAIIVGKNCTLKNSVVTDGNFHNVFLRADSVAQNVEALDSAWQGAGNATLFVFYEDDAAGAGVTLIDTWAHNTTFKSNVVGYFGHRGAGANWGTVTYTRSKATNVTNGFSDGSQTTAYIVTSPVVTASTTAIGLGGNVNITGGTVAATGDALYIGIGANYTITGIDATAGGVAIIRGYQSTANSLVTISYSTLHDAARAVAFEQHNSYSLDIQHCTLQRISTRYYDNHTLNALASDYNAYDNASIPVAINWTYYPTYTAFKAAGAYDQHSTP